MRLFKEFVEKHKQNSRDILGFGIARVDLSKSHLSYTSNPHKSQRKVLCATFPILNWRENPGSYAVLDTHKNMAECIYKDKSEEIYSLNERFICASLESFSPFLPEALKNPSSHKNIQVLLKLRDIFKSKIDYDTDYRLVLLYEDSKCQNVESVYMKLLALSLGKAKLRSLNLDSIFTLLNNVAWSGNKPYDLQYLRENEIELKLEGKYPVIDFIDKFPRYLMQVIPQYDNIRLLDSSKTRFGAYLGNGGYTQMPGASYINFNAGVAGACMNEGRISSSVLVGEGTDIGGGASILGVLSGGNTEPITIGKNCLLGANSCTGISLGDGCIVDAGIAVLAGGIFTITQEEAKKISQINPSFEIHEGSLYKGRELSGFHGIHYRQDHKTGKMVAFRSSREINLNQDLHSL